MVLTLNLRRWYGDMRRRFWALNGPHQSRLGPWLRPDDYGDYACTPSAIYATFAWKNAEIAYAQGLALAARQRLALYDLSDSGAIHYPPKASEGTA
jgi:hypothetical protein